MAGPGLVQSALPQFGSGGPLASLLDADDEAALLLAADLVGATVGAVVGTTVGALVGAIVAATVGGTAVGGTAVGATVGALVGGTAVAGTAVGAGGKGVGVGDAQPASVNNA